VFHLENRCNNRLNIFYDFVNTILIFILTAIPIYFTFVNIVHGYKIKLVIMLIYLIIMVGVILYVKSKYEDQKNKNLQRVDECIKIIEDIIRKDVDNDEIFHRIPNIFKK